VPQVIADLNHLQRLHEHRGAAIGPVVDESLELGLLIGLHGEAEAAVALDDDGVLQEASCGLALQDGLHAVARAALEGVGAATEPHQLLRGVGANVAVLIDAALDLILGVLVGGEFLAYPRQIGGNLDRAQQVIAEPAHAAEEVADAEKLLGAEDRTGASAGDEGTDVGQAAERCIAFGLQQPAGLSGLRQPGPHAPGICAGLERGGTSLAE